ncbi:XRE family transcriptional regulator [Alkalihalobacillus alcalophilus ATCC 27647 = CGMCC 1.3604]|uniref:DNA-binding protein n=1 Tax=Alkalihalobacillus alcalophilus ATCC 27647 = CGMCC 1.3604 TaxID=1218173 RepID=A0A094YV30_ALKAL|nr:XRE family transcriptional regulator [Alkalihalobacillus alcalophilus]KGA97372.1 DNA-binding protein [Alkalihalobacillus alcalophilus ATCC 27647 = CGMCC 1.3604]MED1561917.1 XRE family transcriptional regulator [Alkalihalobacillus alcalophilus]THG90072.1 XRE family transcriptional regulator [Alkalihalobacillus alcalophilus ATCC 27647 = CGMCC 1.3604]
MENGQMSQMIGSRLRKIRHLKELSLEELADLTGVSKPMLGKIERGESNPTVTTLWKIAKGINIPFSFFIEEEQADVTIVRRESVKSLSDQRGGYDVYPLFPKQSFKPFEIYSVLIKSGCVHVAEGHTKGVEEYIVVEKGEIKVTVLKNEYVLKAGDALHFKAETEHVYENISGVEDCQMTMVIYYPVV